MDTFKEFHRKIVRRAGILKKAGIIEEPLLPIPFGRGAWSEEVQKGMKGSRIVRPVRVLEDVEED